MTGGNTMAVTETTLGGESLGSVSLEEGRENKIMEQNGGASVVKQGYNSRPAGKVSGRTVDLRSDTLTQPTPAMRAAMANAEVGDDVYNADPTANKLQEIAAQMFGKEAGLFISSGTMGNLISVLVHCEMRGSEVIIGSESHIHHYEQGGISSLGGVYPKVVPNLPDGSMDLLELEAAIQEDDLHLAVTRLICLENSHNRRGGRCISVEYTDKVGELAKKHGLKLHIDGARIFNAATALGVPVDRLVRAADSVSICLSKGLAAPVGSILVGSQEFIDKARRLRKVLGGAMRQIGILCAAGMISLNEMSKRLNEDHENARKMAEGLNAIPGLQVDIAAVESNIVNITVTSKAVDAGQLVALLEEKGVFVLSLDPGRIRLVTHYHITGSDAQFAISCFRDILLTTSS